MKKYYRLEYNESTGTFHLESDKTKPENMNGWNTISRGLHEKTCAKFIESMTDKYKLNNPGAKPPLFIIVQNDFFMKSTPREYAIDFEKAGILTENFGIYGIGNFDLTIEQVAQIIKILNSDDLKEIGVNLEKLYEKFHYECFGYY